jgi:hypothetical protein
MPVDLSMSGCIHCRAVYVDLCMWTWSIYDKIHATFTSRFMCSLLVIVPNNAYYRPETSRNNRVDTSGEQSRHQMNMVHLNC